MTAIVASFEIASQPKSDLAKTIAAAALAKLATESKKGGVQGAASGRSDMFRINPYLLNIKDGFNSRDMEDPANIEHIDMLARSIAEVGVREPLKVFTENGVIYVSNGHSRLLAVFRAIEVYGAEVVSVPVITEDKYASEADRIMTQIVSNSGKPFSPFEQGVVFKRLIALGLTEKQIADRAGLSITRVIQLLELQAAPEEVKALVRKGLVSATLAWQTLKSVDGDAEKVEAVLTTAVETAAARGKAKATAKDVAGSTRFSAKRTAADLIGKAEVVEADGKVSLTLSVEDYAALKAALGL